MEEKKDEIKYLKEKSIEKYTGVYFGKEVDETKKDIVKANMTNPAITALHILEDSAPIIRTGADGGTLYMYNGRCYDCLTNTDIDKIILDFCIKYDITSAWKNVNLIIRALKIHNQVKRVKELNPEKNYINMKNGVLNINTGGLLPHSPDYFFDHYINIDYEKDKKECPIFINFLNDIFRGDLGLIENAIRLGGYLLDSSNKSEKCFFFDGNGGNGKSVLMNIYTLFFSERNENTLVSSLSLSALEREDKEKTDLIHSRINVCAENKSGYHDCEFLKKLVSGDFVTIYRKNKDPYSFRYTGKIIISGNGLPKFSDTSDGIYRRILIFKFLNQYKTSTEIEDLRKKNMPVNNIKIIDRDLFSKMKEEAPSILNLFLEGLKRLRNDKYEFLVPESSKNAIIDLKRDSDSAREFLEINYKYDKDNFTTLDEIYNNYRSWYYDNVNQGNLKFRSNEMAKRIREVFKIEEGERIKIFDDKNKKYVTKVSYPISFIENEIDYEEKTMDEIKEIITKQNELL